MLGQSMTSDCYTTTAMVCRKMRSKQPSGIERQRSKVILLRNSTFNSALSRGKDIKGFCCGSGLVSKGG